MMPTAWDKQEDKSNFDVLAWTPASSFLDTGSASVAPADVPNGTTGSGGVYVSATKTPAVQGVAAYLVRGAAQLVVIYFDGKRAGLALKPTDTVLDDALVKDMAEHSRDSVKGILWADKHQYGFEVRGSAMAVNSVSHTAVLCRARRLLHQRAISSTSPPHSLATKPDVKQDHVMVPRFLSYLPLALVTSIFAHIGSTISMLQL